MYNTVLIDCEKIPKHDLLLGISFEIFLAKQPIFSVFIQFRIIAPVFFPHISRVPILPVQELNTKYSLNPFRCDGWLWAFMAYKDFKQDASNGSIIQQWSCIVMSLPP